MKNSKVLPTTLDEDYEDYIEPSFKFMSEKFICEGFRVYNLSQKSRLLSEIIPKVDVDFVRRLFLK